MLNTFLWEVQGSMNVAGLLNFFCLFLFSEVFIFKLHRKQKSMAVPFSNTKLRVPRGFQNILEGTFMQHKSLSSILVEVQVYFK